MSDPVSGPVSLPVGRPLHVGVVLPHSGVPDVAACARHAERAGLDGVWFGDHLVTGAAMLDSAMALAAAAAVTTRVSVGWSVLLPALRAPVWAAKAVATLQVLSGGRAQLGVGIGVRGEPDEWAAAGMSPEGRAARTDAFLDVLPGLLIGRPTVVAGPGGGHEVTLAPAAAPPPLWIGGGPGAGVDRALRHGGGWLASLLTPAQLAEHVGELVGRAERAGVAPPPVATIVFADPGGSGERAAQVARGYGLDEPTIAGLATGGGPDQIAEHLAAYHDAGADTLIVSSVAHDPLAAIDILAQARDMLRAGHG